MGTIFDDATPEQEREYLDRMQKEDFLRACRGASLWRILAGRHKHAADVLYSAAWGSYVRQERRYAAGDAARPNPPPGTVGESTSRVLQGEELLDHENVNLLGDYYLLAGYALECLLKGCAIAADPGLIESGESMSKDVKHHRLNRLAELCGLATSAAERELLDVISRYVDWGKYPAPGERAKFPTRDPDDQRRNRLSIGHPFDDRGAQQLVDGIYNRALAAMAAHVST